MLEVVAPVDQTICEIPVPEIVPEIPEKLLNGGFC
jgi:hypothetical protein